MKAMILGLCATGLLLSLVLILSCRKDDTKKKAGYKTYLLIHGANHGAWAFNKVVPLLRALGHRVEAIDLPSHGNDKTPPETVTLQNYVQKVVDVANAISGEVILVGHSSGGVTISQAAEQLGTKKVEKLIFLDAFLPRNGESVFALAAKFIPPSPTGEPGFADSFIFDGTGATFTLDADKVTNFLYHDCSAADVSFAKANLGKQPVAPFATPVQLTDAIYGTIPKYYIICSEAKNANMSEMAKNVTITKTVTIPTSHSPFFSQPETLVSVIVSF
jgi:pimeloyl-ACP methyl ester carboxylesterase